MEKGSMPPALKEAIKDKADDSDDKKEDAKASDDKKKEDKEDTNKSEFSDVITSDYLVNRPTSIILCCLSLCDFCCALCCEAA